MFWRKKVLETSRVTVTAEVETKPRPSTNMTPEQAHAHWIKTRGRHPKGEHLRAAKDAETKWNQQAQAVYKAWTSSDPEYKIVQEDAGHYVIKRRKTKAAQLDYAVYHEPSLYSLYLEYRPYYPWADQIEANTDMTPKTWYETVKDHTSPKMAYRGGYSKYDRGGTYQNGWNDLQFNVFADAEAYLQRMVRQPEEKEVGYDYPPLTRR